jgi:hypothetical protein
LTFSVLTIFIFTLTKRISIEFNRLKNCGSNEDVGTNKKKKLKTWKTKWGDKFTYTHICMQKSMKVYDTDNSTYYLAKGTLSP